MYLQYCGTLVVLRDDCIGRAIERPYLLCHLKRYLNKAYAQRDQCLAFLAVHTTMTFLKTKNIFDIKKQTRTLSLPYNDLACMSSNTLFLLRIV